MGNITNGKFGKNSLQIDILYLFPLSRETYEGANSNVWLALSNEVLRGKFEKVNKNFKIALIAWLKQKPHNQ